MERKHASHTFQLYSDDDSNLCVRLCVFVYFTAHNLESKCWKKLQGGMMLIKNALKTPPRARITTNFHPFHHHRSPRYYVIEPCSILWFSLSSKHKEHDNTSLFVVCSNCCCTFTAAMIGMVTDREGFIKNKNKKERKISHLIKSEMIWQSSSFWSCWSLGMAATSSPGADGNRHFSLISRKRCNKGNSIAPRGTGAPVPDVGLFFGSLTCTQLHRRKRCLASNSWLVWR